MIKICTCGKPLLMVMVDRPQADKFWVHKDGTPQCAEPPTQAEPTISVLAFQEGEWWSAQCLQYDIAAQAKTLPDLFYELGRTLAGYYALAAKAGDAPFAGIGPAPKNFWDMFPAQAKKIEELEAERDRLREALEWYEEKADAAHRYLNTDPPMAEALIALITELSLDDGARAKAALTPKEPTHE